MQILAQIARSQRASVVFVFVLFSCVVALAGKEFVMPTAQHARSYPAHDEHQSEKTTVAIDPYDTTEKAQIFSVNFRDYGYLPVFFVVTNDSDQVVSLANMKAQLNTANRTKLYPASTDDLLRRMSRPTQRQMPNPLPVPLPGKKIKGTVSRKAQDEIGRAHFAARAVEPHSSASGFLFFDIEDISAPLAGATFYLNGVRDGNGNELMYFEIPLEKYVGSGDAVKP